MGLSVYLDSSVFFAIFLVYYCKIISVGRVSILTGYCIFGLGSIFPWFAPNALISYAESVFVGLLYSEKLEATLV